MSRRVKFEGFKAGDAVEVSVRQGDVLRGAVVSAWQAVAAPTPPGSGTFRARVSIVDENWADVAQGDVIETVAPGRVRVNVDQFAGWANNDARMLWVSVDYGERYALSHLDHPDLPDANTLFRFGDGQAGYCPGVVSGHAMRGTDMSGNQVLNATYDQGNGAPLGTLDQTVSVYVSDGLSATELTFTVRLIHPEVYYADRQKTLAANALETARRGLIYVSRDGDFSGAPAARAETPLRAGIYHRTIPDGRFDRELLRRDGYPWSNFPESAAIYFKAGETYFPTESISPDWTGINGTWDTWYHAGVNGSTDATLDAAALETFDPTDDRPLMRSNNFVYIGSRVTRLTLHVSDYDVSDVTWREWWNIIKYTNKSGTLTPNTSGVATNGFNGETLSNGNGVYTQVVSDDGVDTLVCRQVVNTANVDDLTAEQAYFADGDTLTGQTGGATLTFVAAGSRQDRTRKTPVNGVLLANMRGLLFDRVQNFGANTAFAGLGPGAVLSDVLIKNYWNYGAQQTGGVASCSWSETGVVTVQPLGYPGTPRSFGGATVSGNRNFFNTMIAGTELALNNVSHAARRFKDIEEYSAHYCCASTYGGHGLAHQPMHRLVTDGATEEGQTTAQFYGCSYNGAASQIQFSSLGEADPPFTPKVIRMENLHLRANFASGSNNMNSFFSNYVLRNAILEHADIAEAVGSRNISWIGSASEPSYNQDPDVNAVEPIVEFCTFVAKLNTSPASTVAAPLATLRAIPITYRNNAFVIDQSVMASVDAGIQAQADAPADFDAALRPLATAQAYQSAAGDIPRFDGAGVTRPATGASQGALEPL